MAATWRGKGRGQGPTPPSWSIAPSSRAARQAPPPRRRRPPPPPAALVPTPDSIDPRLADALRARGIGELYSHQARAVELLQKGGHVVVVTPTASGKTLCYNLPVLQALLTDSAARALYLFPTK